MPVTLTERTYTIGALWEENRWAIQYDVEVTLDADIVACPHCSPPQERTHDLLVDDVTWTEPVVRCPRVVVAYNEGGHASTGVCLDCILDAVKE